MSFFISACCSFESFSNVPFSIMCSPKKFILTEEKEVFKLRFLKETNVFVNHSVESTGSVEFVIVLPSCLRKTRAYDKDSGEQGTSFHPHQFISTIEVTRRSDPDLRHCLTRLLASTSKGRTLPAMRRGQGTVDRSRASTVSLNCLGNRVYSQPSC